MSQFRNITSSNSLVLPAYIAQPSSAPKAAIVVLQEIFGVNTHIQAVTDCYAEQGLKNSGRSFREGESFGVF